MPETARSLKADIGFDPIGAFAASTASTRALWFRPLTGESLVALGSAAILSPEAAADWRGPGPLLIGGFAFDQLAEPSSLWEGFGRGLFFVPRWLGASRGQFTQVTMTPPQADVLTRAESASPPRLGLQAEEWKALVSEVARGIRSGALGVSKVVLARAAQRQTQISVDTALRSLARNYPTCTLFALEHAGACFLGASPERLVAVHGAVATTMALAGSAPRGASPEQDAAIAARLLRDPKERTEHAVVVEAIREALAPVAAGVLAEAEPRLEKLANLQHLCTPIRAQLLPGQGLLAVARQLHPTPAVGGYPRENALRLIREREHLDRGWYAGPFGWVDARGEGEFVVGLRSALVRDRAATFFAGCGIVGESRPDEELAEWGWKLRPMLGAFGCTA